MAGHIVVPSVGILRNEVMKWRGQLPPCEWEVESFLRAISQKGESLKTEPVVLLFSYILVSSCSFCIAHTFTTINNVADLS